MFVGSCAVFVYYFVVAWSLRCARCLFVVVLLVACCLLIVACCLWCVGCCVFVVVCGLLFLSWLLFVSCCLLLEVCRLRSRWPLSVVQSLISVFLLCVACCSRMC